MSPFQIKISSVINNLIYSNRCHSYYYFRAWKNAASTWVQCLLTLVSRCALFMVMNTASQVDNRHAVSEEGWRDHQPRTYHRSHRRLCGQYHRDHSLVLPFAYSTHELQRLFKGSYYLLCFLSSVVSIQGHYCMGCSIYSSKYNTSTMWNNSHTIRWQNTIPGYPELHESNYMSCSHFPSSISTEWLLPVRNGSSAQSIFLALAESALPGPKNQSD